MQHEHRCSYCDHGHTIRPDEIQTAWAFVKCESCGKLSILRSRRGSDRSEAKGAAPRKKKIAVPTAGATKPPPFLATASAGPAAAPAQAAAIAPKAAALVAGRNRGALSVGLLIIAIGMLVFNAQRLKNQAERLAESSVATTAATATNNPAPSEPSQVTTNPAPEAAPTVPGNNNAPTAGAALAPPPPDAVRTSAAAPAAEPSQPAATPAPFLVEVSKSSAILRSGPGTNFRRLGLAGTEAKLPVLEWRGDWFRVAIGGSEMPGNSADGTAWIRNDLVRRATNN